MKISTLAVSLSLIATAAWSQAQAPKIDRAEGAVTALTASSITLAEAGGKQETIALLPTWLVIVSKPIAIDQIAPGSYLGTTNHAKPDGTGVSTEVHASPPGATGPGLDFLMDAAAQTTMTNGVVATVASSPGGRVLEVNYGSGVRKITVPPGVPVVLNTPGDRGLIKVGGEVRVVTFTPATGGPARQFITVGVDGAPPPR